MKTKISSLVAVALMLLLVTLTSGCVAMGNGNVGKNIQPPKYRPDEHAVVKKNKEYKYDISGKLISSHEVEDKNGLAVADGIIHHKTDMTQAVGVAQAQANGSLVLNGRGNGNHNISGPNEAVFGSGVWNRGGRW